RRQVVNPFGHQAATTFCSKTAHYWANERSRKVCRNFTLLQTLRPMSGRLDSNQRPPEPHSGALAKLRHAPMLRPHGGCRTTQNPAYRSSADCASSAALAELDGCVVPAAERITNGRRGAGLPPAPVFAPRVGLTPRVPALRGGEGCAASWLRQLLETTPRASARIAPRP